MTIKRQRLGEACEFTVFNSVHAAVGDLYGFVQSDKRCLQTESGRRDGTSHTALTFLILIRSSEVVLIGISNIHFKNLR